MSDATSAYRGYRLQTLYTLFRILEPCEKIDLVFQPEGAEDCAIWDDNDCLLEAVQAKAYSANLTLSLLSPEKADSFLYRVNRLISAYPEAKIKIVSFGDVGIELIQATQKNGRERKRVARKIAEYNFLSETDAQQLLSQLEIISVIESELEKRVFIALQNLCTGINPVPAFEMLNFWLYTCAERKTKITRSNVIKKISDVGRFIAERNAYHSEWFRSITPIENYEVDTQAREQLLNEFYRGISARYDHIHAGVDKPRISKLNEIVQKFKKKQVVIIHGASGQGKTATAYRYLHDFFPDQWRFQVRLIENRQQALNIATALSGQAKALGVPVAVYLDVSPSDVGWDELIKQLSSHKNIQILVTVREEDFRRANISGAEIQFDEVELKLERSEAEEIYQFLVQTQPSDRFLDFEDAWNRFGGNGPLMEFVYLITQGDSLRERLQQQVRRIQDEVRRCQCSHAELELLRLVSVASAFEARLKLRELVHFLRLPAWQRTLELFEEEYLLRTSEDRTLVGGLHPIRSTILADILTDPIFTWVDAVSTFLPFIFEQDLGNFLLYVFSRHFGELESLFPALNNYQPKHWIAISGVVRALIWLGIKEYVESNRQVILEAYERVDHAWVLVLDFDIADAVPGAADSWVSSLASWISEEGLAHIYSLRSRQEDKKQVFARTAAWLSHLSHELTPPDSELAWTGMAEVLFWAGRLQLPLPILNWLALVDLNAAVETLPLEILADMSLSLFYSSKTIYRSWLNTNCNTLLNRFRQETQTVAWEDDGQNIRIHFVIEVLTNNVFLSENLIDQRDIQREFLNASVERLHLLRRFFPDREWYGSKGYGHLIWSDSELHDETEKSIPISNLPIQRLVAVNSIFKALGEQDMRPETWEDYSRSIIKLREAVLQILQQLNRGLVTYFRRKRTTQILGESVTPELWTNTKQLLTFSPLLPRCAFDEWGFVTENIDHTDESNNNRSHQIQSQVLALEKYKAYLKGLNAYIRACSNFFGSSLSVSGQAEYILNFHSHFKNGGSAQAQKIAKDHNIDLQHQAHLSVLNLGDALRALPKLQAEFKRLFQHIQTQDLEILEKLEEENFKILWYSWYFFAFHPNKCFQNANRDCLQHFNNKVREIRNNIKKELRSISSENLHIGLLSEDIQWEGEQTLWIKVDGENPFEVYESITTVISAIRQAINAVHDNELRRYAIEFTWSNFVIVPLIKGKSLDITAWKFSSIFFAINLNQNLGWWRFSLVAIPPTALAQLSLSTWNHSRLAMAQKFMNSVSRFTFWFSHIKDFARLPGLDELGNRLLQNYIQRLFILLNEVFQEVFNLELEVTAYLSTLASLEIESRPYLAQVIQSLVELNEEILPMNNLIGDGMIQMSIIRENADKWIVQINKIQRLIVFLYLNWVSDILEEEITY